MAEERPATNQPKEEAPYSGGSSSTVNLPITADDVLSLRITIDFHRQPGAPTVGRTPSMTSAGGGGLEGKNPGHGAVFNERSTGGGGLDDKNPGDSRDQFMKARE